MLTSIFQQRNTLLLKTRYLIWARYALCAVALVLLIAGCGSGIQTNSSLSQAVIGNWTGDCSKLQPQFGNFQKVEFFADGTISISGGAANYSFPDDHHIKLASGYSGVVYNFSMSGNTITLSDTVGGFCTLQQGT